MCSYGETSGTDDANSGRYRGTSGTDGVRPDGDLATLEGDSGRAGTEARGSECGESLRGPDGLARLRGPEPYDHVWRRVCRGVKKLNGEQGSHLSRLEMRGKFQPWREVESLDVHLVRRHPSSIFDPHLELALGRHAATVGAEVERGAGIG